MRHSLLESVTLSLSTVLRPLMYSLPCPLFFAPTRAELRVVLVAGCSASAWARFLFRHQRGARPRPSRVNKTRSLSKKKKVEGHLGWHLSALVAYEMAGNEFEYVGKGKARQCVVFVLPVESTLKGVK